LYAPLGIKDRRLTLLPLSFVSYLAYRSNQLAFDLILQLLFVVAFDLGVMSSTPVFYLIMLGKQH